MSSASREIARRHPLVARAIGVVDGVVLVARSNWDILEVRDLSGRLVMRHEIALAGEALLGAVGFAGAFVVVEQSAGVVALGARVWNLAERRWCASVHRDCAEVGLVGTGAGWLALAHVTGVDWIDPADGTLQRRIHVGGALSVAAHPATPEVWVIAGEGDSSPARGSIALVEGSVVRRTRPLDQVDPHAAWMDDRVLVASPRGSLTVLDADLQDRQSLPGLDVNLSSVEVTGGRWAALLAPYGESALLDLHSGAVERRQGICFVEPDGEHVVWADTMGAERRAL